MFIKTFIMFIPLFISLFLGESSLSIYLAGDSTMAIKKEDRRPETGWGEKLSLFFNDKITINNFAKNGRSSKSFINEGIWDSLINSVDEGDYVFIQFGHNDEKKNSPERYTTIGEYKSNLQKFVNEVLAKKCTPVLLTPLVRRRFDESGRFYRSHGDYPKTVREVAEVNEITLIDMQKASEELLIKLGEEKSKELYLILNKGENKNYPEGKEDNTHLCSYGAEKIASLVAELIDDSCLKLKNYLTNKKTSKR